jgi:hypothetical protein
MGWADKQNLTKLHAHLKEERETFSTALRTEADHRVKLLGENAELRDTNARISAQLLDRERELRDLSRWAIGLGALIVGETAAILITWLVR